MRLLVAAVLLLPSVAAAAPQKLTLEQIVAKALTGPKARMAAGDKAAAEARSDEADATRYPKLKATAFGTASPDITCLDVACSRTDPQDFAWRFDGIFVGAAAEVTQPLYTFGKIKHARRAAQAGVEAQTALADEVAGDLAVDAARAYWGLKVAREMRWMLDDGIEQIEKALAKMNGNDKDRPDVSIQDRQRIAVLLAEAKVQRADAMFAEQQAIAGVRALVGSDDVDIDDSELGAVTRKVPMVVPSSRRPQLLAAKQGALAADELAKLQRSYFYPDFAVVGSAVVSKAQGVENPESVFANDPYNRAGVAILLAMRWEGDPWTIKAKLDRAKAEADKAHAQADLARIGAALDAETARADAEASNAKLDATAEGEKAARAWLASVLQAEAIGAAEPKDFADAYIAWFQMRARWAQAVMQWNVGVLRMDRAAGEFSAVGHRPITETK